MYPVRKAQLIESFGIVAPLCRVIAQEIDEEKLTEEQLDQKQATLFKFIK
jgi:hypothetical protein